MSLQMKVVVFNIGTGIVASTVGVTGAGFAPKAVLFFASGRTEAVDTGGAATSNRLIGFAAATTEGGGLKQSGVGSRDADAITAAAGFQHDFMQRIDSSVLALLNTGTLDGQAHVTSFDADGCTLTIDNQFAISQRVVALFIGGTDITNIEIGAFSSPGSGTPPFTADVTTGFTCTDDQAVLFMVGGRSSADNDNDTDSTMSFGMATSPTNQCSWTASADDAHPTTTAVNRHLQTGALCYANWNATANSLVRRAGLNAWITNGFQLLWKSMNAVVSRIYWLVIKGGRWKLAEGTTATSLTTVPVTGVGFPPVGGIVLSASLAADSGTGSTSFTANDVWSIGAFTGAANRACVALYNLSGSGTSAVGTRVEHDETYAQIDNTGALLGLMDVQSMDSDGVTFVMDDADPAGSLFAVLFGGSAGGAVGVGGGATRRRRRR